MLTRYSLPTEFSLFRSRLTFNAFVSRCSSFTTAASASGLTPFSIKLTSMDKVCWSRSQFRILLISKITESHKLVRLDLQVFTYYLKFPWLHQIALLKSVKNLHLMLGIVYWHLYFVDFMSIIVERSFPKRFRDWSRLKSDYPFYLKLINLCLDEICICY